MMRKITHLSIFIVLFILMGTLSAQNEFKKVWQNQTWAEGALHPSGALWNTAGPYDFDNDGMQDFLTSSSWSGSFLNGVYHYEADANNDIQLRWFYYFDLDTSLGNFSSVTVGDLDGDNIPEAIVLTDAYAGTHGLQIFEWDPDSASFPSTPTATWDLGLDHGIFEAGQIQVANLDSDANQEVIATVIDTWAVPGRSHFIIFELQNQNFALPSWKVEIDDSISAQYNGYAIYTTDLDKDGLQEIHTVDWNFFDYIVYENTGTEDEYALQSQFFVTIDDAFSNQGLVAGNLDNDDYNELYLASNTGLLYAMQDSGDVGKLGFKNFHYLGFYESGIRQLLLDDLDGDDKQDLYIAGNTGETVYDWEYEGGSALDPSSFTPYTMYMADTTDESTFRAVKFVAGDIDNDGLGDLIVSSASFSADQPTLIMLEYDKTTAIGDKDGITPAALKLDQNYPNPFNPATQISYTLKEKGHVRLEIFDLLGKKIMTLKDGLQLSGNYNVQWTGIDQKGNAVPSGLYIYKLSIGNKTLSKRMTLIK